PMRPSPLMPTRMVTGLSPLVLANHRPPEGRQSLAADSPITGRSFLNFSSLRPRRRWKNHIRTPAAEHLGGDTGVSIGNPQLTGAFVGQGEQSANPTRNRVLGQRWIGQGPQFLQRGLPVGQPQLTGGGQVRRRI